MLARLEKPTFTDRFIMLFLAVFMMLAAADVAFSAEPVAVHELTMADAEAGIADALMQKGAGEFVAVTLVGKYPATLHSGKDELLIEIRDLAYDNRALRWSCTLAVHEGDTLTNSIALSGRYETQTQIPVLTRRLHSTDVIEAKDVEWQLVPEHRLRKDTITELDELVGKSPRRVISEQRPVRANELVLAEVLSKGTMVDMLFKTASMEIRTTGEALNGGGIGDLVRVRNLSSNIVVQGRITGANTVDVNPLAAKELASIQ